MTVEVNKVALGSIINGLKIVDCVVYMPIPNGDSFEDIRIGSILKENWSWEENQNVPDIKDIALVVLNYDNNGIVFSRKHLVDKQQVIEKFFENLSAEEKEEIFDNEIEKKRAERAEIDHPIVFKVS